MRSRSGTSTTPPLLLLLLTTALAGACGGAVAAPAPQGPAVTVAPPPAASAPLPAEGAKLTLEQIAREKKRLFALPRKDQAPLWRKWAAAAAEPVLQREALVQLAWAEDPEGVDLAIKALAGADHRVRAVAAQVLAHYGAPGADAARPALHEALKTADDGDRGPTVWALVALGDKAAFAPAMELHRRGALGLVERLGGGSAFDPEQLAGLVSLDELAALARDPHPAVRRLVATVLSRNAEPRWTRTLVELVRDPEPEVRDQAAGGLARIAGEPARGPLREILRSADKDGWQRLLEGLRDGSGGEGLVLALDSVKASPEETHWFQTRQIFEMIRELADPRAADALVKWAETARPAAHWAGEVGLRLAEIGDVRAARLLGNRMKLDPSRVYQPSKFWEADAGGHLSRSDLPRIVSARMLADLAVVHPEARAEISAAAEDSVLAWAKDRPQPHANALRFLATIGSKKALRDMRAWAFPTTELPRPGAQPPFPSEYATAQMALRYLGRMKDAAAFPRITDQLRRKKDRKLDITQEGLQSGGVAMLGMALRAVAYGAAQGLAEWGDARAVKPLTELIEDETWHEEAREAACEALAACADDEAMAEVARKAKEAGAHKESARQFIAVCYAATLERKPVSSAAPALAALITPDVALGVRMAVARALGASGFDAATEARLFEKLEGAETRNAAALALIMGSTGDTAARVVARYADFGKDALDDLKDHYFRAFGYWSDEDLRKGRLYRWVDNALAIGRIKIDEVPQDWARQRLASQLDNLRLDNGPHSETRVVLRYRLLQAARSGDRDARKGAFQTLHLMNEKGVLMSLRHEKGDAGEAARKTLHELQNPRPVVAEDPSGMKP